MEEYNYLSGYGDYGTSSPFIPKKTVEDITANAPKEMDTFKEVADKISEIEAGGGEGSADLTELNEKVDAKADKTEVDSKFEEIETVLAEKADASELDGLATEDFVDEKIADLVGGAPTTLDTLKEIADALNDNATMTMVSEAISTKVDTEDFNAHVTENTEAFAAINETLAEKADKNEIPDTSDFITESALEGYATTDYVDGKVAEIEIPTLDGYVQDADYVHTDNNFTDELKTKLEGLSNYDDTALDGRVEALENADYLTTLSGDARYYEKEAANNIFISKSQYEDDMELKADKSELSDYTTDSELANAVHDLVVRLNKLEAQNAVLVEKGTESADDINAMTPEEAASADIVVATDEAIEALSEPKTFNSISIAGGEVGDNTVINLLATDSVDVNGLTVSGTKGSVNGKIVYGTNDITISNMNIEPGCTVYNVFEGKQDQASENCVENFTATNIVVNDTDLAHNVFNIYQFNNGANVLIKDSSFNLDVANSNVLRVSNLTNAENVTITFENVDWNYEDKGYTDNDLKWAGLMIYQPYSTDAGSNGDTSHMQTWTINVKNCRYNGTPVTENEVGTIRQALYQYNVGGNGLCEDATAFGTVVFE